MPSYFGSGLAEGIEPYAKALVESRLNRAGEEKRRSGALEFIQNLKNAGIDIDQLSSVNPGEGTVGFSSLPSLINLLGQNLSRSQKEQQTGQAGIDQLTTQINQLAEFNTPEANANISKLQDQFGQMVSQQQRGEAGVSSVKNQAKKARELGLLTSGIPGLDELQDFGGITQKNEGGGLIGILNSFFNRSEQAQTGEGQVIRGKDGRLYRIKKFSPDGDHEVELVE